MPHFPGGLRLGVAGAWGWWLEALLCPCWQSGPASSKWSQPQSCIYVLSHHLKLLFYIFCPAYNRHTTEPVCGNVKSGENSHVSLTLWAVIPLWTDPFQLPFLPETAPMANPSSATSHCVLLEVPSTFRVHRVKPFCLLGGSKSSSVL